MTRHLIRRQLCRLGFHRWVYLEEMFVPGRYDVQKRLCEVCAALQGQLWLSTVWLANKDLPKELQ